MTHSANPQANEIPSTAIAVNNHADILASYAGTPIEDLLAYHNLGADLRDHPKPEMLIATCMDYRIAFRLPKDFAYIIRAGGANTRALEFHISAAVANGVKTICVIGHDQCAMCGVSNRKQQIVDGLLEHGGWENAEAESHFEECAPHSDIRDVAAFVRSEVQRLSGRFPRVMVAPLLYSVKERVLYQLDID
jgi:carbonic anhydrase